MNRRHFLALGAGWPLLAAQPAKPRIGVVRSTHARLPRPSSPEDPLDYERVRDMVFQSIEYAGGLGRRIKPGSWLVIKPNLCFLSPQPSYRSGDIADLRVVRAVLEYVGKHAPAARVTIAEGGSYRGLRDPGNDSVVTQNGARADATNFEWPAGEFPGFAGSVGALLREAAQQFPGKRFDYVDLNYDGVRDASGRLARVEVSGGGFGARPDYFVTNTICKCDFLVSVPVLKVHEQCGMTACLKNYVGTAPREGYSVPGRFWNVNLHAQHSLDNRIDPMFVDLATFHPPDFCVVDAIRGLQYTEHNNGRADQMLRHNLVFAGADPVACDTLGAYLLGYHAHDMEFLHLAQARGMGSMEMARFDVAGDDPAPLRSRWAKPRNWYGRCNREWMIAPAGGGPGTRLVSRTDTLRFPEPRGGTATVRVIAEGARKGYLWAGVRGKVTAHLNGQKVMEEENTTRYRVGQFRSPVELKSGENLLAFNVVSESGDAQLSALITGPRNDGDTVDGIRWRAS